MVQVSQHGTGSQVTGIGRRLADPRPLLRKIGILQLAAAQKAFRQQGLSGPGQWPSRITPNIPGILSDLAKGPRVKERRWQGRPALSDTGMLRMSLSPAQASAPTQGKYRIVVGTTVKYAGLHQFGGETSIPITQAIRRNLAILLRKHRRIVRREKGRAPMMRDEVKADRSSKYARLGFLFSMDVWKQKVRARPFLGLTPELRRDIIATAQKWLTTGTGGVG